MAGANLREENESLQQKVHGMLDEVLGYPAEIEARRIHQQLQGAGRVTSFFTWAFFTCHSVSLEDAAMTSKYHDILGKISILKNVPWFAESFGQVRHLELESSAQLVELQVKSEVRHERHDLGAFCLGPNRR